MGFNWKIWGKDREEKLEKTIGLEIDGAEEYRSPLSTINIAYVFCTKETLISAKVVQMIAEELSVPDDRVMNDMKSLTDEMLDELTCIVEYPYVDEYYRDAYYNFFSRKHNLYNRNCFRISFFTPDVSETNYYEIDLAEKFLGYTVVQPTPKCVIGYTFLHPTVYKNCDFSICMCARDSFVMGRKMSTMAFPYSGQDGEYRSCAENSVLLMFDYFSRRYNRYARVLPSHIADLLTDSVSNRQQPSHGADIDSVITVLNIKGITTRRYEKVEDENVNELDNCFAEERFNEMLSIYVDSGFPVYISTKSHAYLIVGKSNESTPSSPTYIMVNDNNCRPYSVLTNLSEIESFIIPVSENILIEAKDIKPTEILNQLKDDNPSVHFLDDQKEYYHRLFLTTSRSYKTYIVKANMEKENRELIVCTAMPKFIWVSESIEKGTMANKLESNVVDVACVFDATDALSTNNRLLMAKTKTHLLIPVHDKTRLQRKIYSVNKSEEILHPFMNNLKGVHLQWKES